MRARSQRRARPSNTTTKQKKYQLTGVYDGFDPCLRYCVEWKVLKARPAKKSRGCINPATALICQPVARSSVAETSRSCGIRSRANPRSGRARRNSGQAARG